MARYKLWIVILLCAVVLIYVVPSVMMTRDDAVRVALQMRLRQVAFGLNEYYLLYNSYPPNRVAIETSSGLKDIQSWRALVLPMIANSQEVKRYDLQRPWDDAQNLAVAKSIDAFSNFSGESSTSLFLTNSACLIESRADALLLLSTPKRSELWSTPNELTAEELWSASRDSPRLVMIGLGDGDHIPLREIATSKEECGEVLNYGRLSEERRGVYQSKVAKWRERHRTR